MIGTVVAVVTWLVLGWLVVRELRGQRRDEWALMRERDRAREALR